ncbi:MAG: PQQ-dependent sugar dehydrogenase [Gammaproteobacteria bacterium]|nr:PQQ-dependent sugar dehydrogenase [Gammaproteobacteria bacterium]
MPRRYLLPVLLLIVTPVAQAAAHDDIIEKIQMPEGFEIHLFGEVPNARSLTQAPDGTVFIGNRSGDKVWALRDTDGDHVADERWVIAEGLNSPNGVAWFEGDLYISEIGVISKVADILDQPRGEYELQVVYDDLPTDEHHGWRYIAFGPDGKLYVPIGVPCNVCNEEGYGIFIRMDPDGSNVEQYAKGIRNSVGFDFDPETGDLWFTDNGRDWMGDNLPDCELNHAPREGMHFGFPYCHEGDVKDPEFGEGVDCSQYTPPVVELGPHVAPLGMRFYTGRQFPEKYRGGIFIAEHGSWNRSEKIGYRVKFVDESGDTATQEVFARGWLQPGEKVLGRPVDVLVRPDGSLLVSDDAAGLVYRIHYTGAAAN